MRLQLNNLTKPDGDAKLKEAWAKFLEAEIPAVIAGAVKRGIKKEVAERVVNAHLANLKKWRKISKEVGRDEKKLAAALWDNIYSKVKY